MIAAAKRGVAVRVLLSDGFLNPKDPKDNTNTVAYLNALARREGLDIQARVITSALGGLDKIHNKGVIVDGQQAFVSSINWSYNSPANNREVGLIIDNPQIGAYFTDIFTYDWYNGTPADYPLITEVHPENAFLELSHFGPGPVDLGGWTLSTAAGPVTLPKGTVIYPGKPLVLARDKAAFTSKYGNIPTLVELPGLTLNSTRDALKLRKSSRLIDAMAWGEGEPGWKLSTPAKGALCRSNPGKDTNSYLDWAPVSTPTPGIAGCGK